MDLPLGASQSISKFQRFVSPKFRTVLPNTPTVLQVGQVPRFGFLFWAFGGVGLIEKGLFEPTERIFTLLHWRFLKKWLFLSFLSHLDPLLIWDEK